jgi:membrane protein implicated in regulation of membrane protease activity
MAATYILLLHILCMLTRNFVILHWGIIILSLLTAIVFTLSTWISHCHLKSLNLPKTNQTWSYTDELVNMSTGLTDCARTARKRYTNYKLTWEQLDAARSSVFQELRSDIMLGRNTTCASSTTEGRTSVTVGDDHDSGELLLTTVRYHALIP